MEYRGRVVSLLMRADDGGTGTVGDKAIPHVFFVAVNPMPRRFLPDEDATV